MTDTQPHDNPGVIAPPPLIVGGFLLAATLLDRLVLRAPFLPFDGLWPGVVVTLVGLGLGFWAIFTLVRHNTSPLPERPTRAVVTEAPYSFTRNPIYVCFIIISIGWALLLDSLWVLAVIPLIIAVLHQGVIVREERYLESKFGEEYRAYKNRVRRWL